MAEYMLAIMNPIFITCESAEQILLSADN